MMIKQLLFCLLFSTMLFAQGGGQAVGIQIQNPSFIDGPAGWQFGSNTGIAQSDFDGNPLGVQAAYAGYKGTFSQTLTTSPADVQVYPQPGYAVEGAYTLQFDVRNAFAAYPGYYTVEIDFGTQELCGGSGWGTRTFKRVTIVCPAPGYIVIDGKLPTGNDPVQGISPFVIKVTENDGSAQGGWPVLVRNFLLMFTPN